MPAPITPAPRTPSRLTSAALSAGRRRLAELLHRLEQCTDHIAAGRVQHDLHEMAGFDLQRRVDVDQEAFVTADMMARCAG
jgi:hypothetical protein